MAAIPLVYLIIRATASGAALGPMLLRPRTLQVLWNTTTLVVAVTLTSVAISLPLAWLLVRTRLPGRAFWRVATAVPLVIPSLVGGYTFVAAFGVGGILYRWIESVTGWSLQDGVYGFTGAWILLTLLSYPYVLLPVSSALRGVDAAQEEAARSLGHSRRMVFWRVILPALRPSILAGSLLVALYTLSDFAAVSLLRYDTFTRVIYVQYQASFNRSYAAVLSLILVLLSAVLLLVEARIRGKATYYRSGPGVRRTAPLVPLGAWQIPALLGLAILVAAAVVLPVGVAVSWLVVGLVQGGTFFVQWDEVFNSVTVAAASALITVVAALPIAFLTVRYRSRLGTLVEKAAYLGYALPGLVVALSLVFFGARFGGPFYQTIGMLLVAYLVLFLPQALGAVKAALLQVSPNVENVARSLGYGPLQVIWKVTLPLIRPGVVSALALVFLTAMKELPAALLLGPIGFRTLATSVWSSVSEAMYARGAVSALLLIGLSLISLTLLLRQEDR